MIMPKPYPIIDNHDWGWEEINPSYTNKPTPITPERQLIFKQMLENLSAEAKEVCQLIFSCPQDFLDTLTHGICKRKIKNYLKSQNWVIPKIERTFKEIRNGIDEIDGDREKIKLTLSLVNPKPEIKYIRRKWHGNNEA